VRSLCQIAIAVVEEGAGCVRSLCQIAIAVVEEGANRLRPIEVQWKASTPFAALKSLQGR
jgi:hypothetical protein